MSSADNSTVSLVQEIVAEVAASTVSNYIALSIMTFLAFEWLITVGDEVNLFWTKKKTVATVLFILNRYTPILYMASSFSGANAWTDSSCNASVLTSIMLDALQYIPWALFSALRVHATTEKRWDVAIFVALLSLAPLAEGMVHMTFIHGEIIPGWGCGGIDTESPALSAICTLSIVSRTSLMLSDLVVVASAWAMTYRTGGLPDMKALTVPSFCARFLVNGSIYFVVLLALNATHLALSLLSVARTGQSAAGPTPSYVVSFTEPITAMLVSRFMLDLQRVKERSCGAQYGESFATEFAGGENVNVLGSLGSTLRTADLWAADADDA
ncbi:uncharacterized protein BXZ73DRAFT_105421 [Epithele typhae]|uniref:uncharacterized protein n=1 Tax=Epithele typhae TaxID=378194 RepID=UPI0020078EC8|nr:uncharacterized protein BXZ73DRAFT_105421 [Epithele typhae]KAH9917901.1 hypothetical protein BXZ73DRAFT_105421 [Epithele typhae]